MAMGLEPKWTDLNEMLATCSDDQLLNWKEIVENPKAGDNFKFITRLRMLVVRMANKSAKDIINELSVAINDELSIKRVINMYKKLEARIAKLEKLVNYKRAKNEGRGREAALRVSELGGTLLSYMTDFDTYAEGELSNKLNKAYTALIDLVDAIDSEVDSY